MPFDCLACFVYFIHSVFDISISMLRSGQVGSSSNVVGSCSGDESGVDETILLGVPNLNLIIIGSIWGSIPTFKIKGGPKSNPETKLTLDELRKFYKDYDIPGHIHLHAPAKEVRADWDIPGIVCLYKLPFE